MRRLEVTGAGGRILERMLCERLNIVIPQICPDADAHRADVLDLVTCLPRYGWPSFDRLTCGCDVRGSVPGWVGIVLQRAAA